MFSARPTSPAGTDALARLSWHDFEHLLAEHYRDQGWRVEYHSPQASLKQLDGAFDLRLYRGNETVIVQCKHWNAAEVQLREVNELLGTMLNEAATRGVLVTRGQYSAEARAVPRRQPRLQLIDGDVLRVMLKLPDHLDTSIPGVALPSVGARKPAKQRRRASDGGMASRLGPLLLVVAVALLLGFFVWRAMSRHAEPVAAPSPDNAAVAAPPPVAPPPAAPVPAPVATPVATPAEPAISHELAERARLREAADAKSARDAHRQSEDALKVMEHNTREVGSAD